jgi:hypothetical protein
MLVMMFVWGKYYWFSLFAGMHLPEPTIVFFSVLASAAKHPFIWIAAGIGGIGLDFYVAYHLLEGRMFLQRFWWYGVTAALVGMLLVSFLSCLLPSFNIGIIPQ